MRGTMRCMDTPDPRRIGLIVVDHGSRRGASNEMLEVMAGMVADVVPYGIVEPAHMELAEPSIQTAFDRCVERGAQMVVVSPYFLLPGRHWDQDIPRLTQAAAARHPNLPFLVAAALTLVNVLYGFFVVPESLPEAKRTTQIFKNVLLK